MIRRSIWAVLLCFPIHIAGHVCIPEPLYFYLFGDRVRASVRTDMPLYLDYAVVGQPHHALVVWALTPPPRVEVATYTFGNFLKGARVHIPRQLGPLSI